MKKLIAWCDGKMFKSLTKCGQTWNSSISGPTTEDIKGQVKTIYEGHDRLKLRNVMTATYLVIQVCSQLTNRKLTGKCLTFILKGAQKLLTRMRFVPVNYEL